MRDRKRRCWEESMISGWEERPGEEESWLWISSKKLDQVRKKTEGVRDRWLVFVKVISSEISVFTLTEQQCCQRRLSVPSKKWHETCFERVLNNFHCSEETLCQCAGRLFLLMGHFTTMRTSVALFTVSSVKREDKNTAKRGDMYESGKER